MPIGGTLSKPQLDKAKFDDYAKQFIRTGVNNAIEQGLNKGLDQLLRRPGSRGS